MKKHIVKLFALGLFLPMASLWGGCLAEPDPQEIEAQEAVGEAEQLLPVSCPARTECNDFCEAKGMIWMGKCQDTTAGACVCRADIETTSVGAGPV